VERRRSARHGHSATAIFGQSSGQPEVLEEGGREAVQRHQQVVGAADVRIREGDRPPEF
jgi:hypothetical protein